MPAFDDLGLREELLRTVEEEGLDRPTALQQKVVPALRRAGNVVARASTGAGKTLAYTLGVLDRLKPREAGEEEAEQSSRLAFLVLTPTLESADRVARAMYPYVQAVGFSVSVPGGGWGLSPMEAEVLVAPPGDLIAAVRGSTLKLDSVEAIVIDGASSILELGDWDTVDALLDLAPRDAQRVVVSAALPTPIEDLVERRVKRALRYPAEPAIREETAEPAVGRVGYVMVGERDKTDILARQLAQARGEGGGPVVFCRTDDRAADLAEQLAIRGFAVGAVGDADTDVSVASADATREELLEESEAELGQTLGYDVPTDAAQLLARHGGDADAVVLVTPDELPHLREIAEQANLTVHALPQPIEDSVSAQRLKQFRDDLRRALSEEDIAAQMLVLEPLFEEFSPAEVAAAATALLRRRRPAAQATAADVRSTATQQTAAPRARASGPTAGASAEPGPAPATWARLYVGAGARDDLRPGDLVGAIAGEANIPGSRIGKIEIRDNFSIVEVQSDVADQVIRAVNGTSIKGRSVRVDYDRGAERAKGGPPRRTDRPRGPSGGGQGMRRGR